MNGQTQLAFIPLHCANSLAQIFRDFFPSTEKFNVPCFCAHLNTRHRFYMQGYRSAHSGGSAQCGYSQLLGRGESSQCTGMHTRNHFGSAFTRADSAVTAKWLWNECECLWTVAHPEPFWFCPTTCSVVLTA